MFQNLKEKILNGSLVALLSVTVLPLGSVLALTDDSASSSAAISPAPKIVINEVYYDVAPNKGPLGNFGPHQNDNLESTFEWIELYNDSSQTVNLKDWTLQTNDYWEGNQWQQCVKPLNFFNRAKLELAPHTFAIVTPYVPAFRRFWMMEIATAYSYKEITLGNAFGCPNNPLENSGKIILRDGSGQIVDQISYGTDTSVLDPAIPAVAEGHSIERKPSGFDTDMATDFIDQSRPTPGKGLR